jgi:hypothetical protein
MLVVSNNHPAPPRLRGISEPIRRSGRYADGATATSVEVAVGAGVGWLGQV